MEKVTRFTPPDKLNHQVSKVARPVSLGISSDTVAVADPKPSNRKWGIRNLKRSE